MNPRIISILAGILVLQIILIFALNSDDEALTANKTSSTLINKDQQGSLKTIDRLVVEGPEKAKVELKKIDGKWIMPGYFNAPVDQVKLNRVLETLPQTKRGFAVATSAGALDRFKVSDDTYERKIVFEKDETTLETIYLGSSAGLRKLHARSAEDQAVYIIEFPDYDAPIKAENWFKRELLGLTEADIQSATINGQGFEGDKAQEVIKKLASLRAEGILGLEAKPEWQKKISVEIKTKDGNQAWTISQPENMQDNDKFYVLKTPANPWYIKLAYWDGDDLLDFIKTDETDTDEPAPKAPN